MAACRGCRQPIRWETTRLGKGIALDPEPRPEGNVVMRGASGMPKIAHVLRDGEEPFEGEERFRTHWESCPDAEKFRQKKAAS